MRILGNLIWFVFGGFVVGLVWWIAGVLAAITIIGIPFAMAAFRIGTFTFWPFGRQVADAQAVGAVKSIFILLGNIVWIILGGVWLALGHLLCALLLAVTIIGIPFAIQHVKLAKLSFTPYGKRIIAVSV